MDGGIAIPNQETTTIAGKLVDEMFCTFSPPEQLHSDQFESTLMKEIVDILKIKNQNFGLSPTIRWTCRKVQLHLVEYVINNHKRSSI